MATEKKIDELLKIAVTLELEGVEFIQSLDYATLCREYNGIGPEWAGRHVRDWITGRFGVFEPAALIHDLRNYESDDTRCGFNYANYEFFINCIKIADASYPWYSWRRYRARALAMAMFDFVSGPGGWTAWHDCYEKRLKKPQTSQQTN